MYGSHGGIKLLPEKIKKTLWVHGLSILLNTTVETTVFQGNLWVRFLRMEHNKKEKEYWSKASFKEKLTTITYLRECFYGPEATTGRLQRFYSFSKRK
jgi:hypothetical protein